ncbi:MAG TPA: histidine phosphatase family protein [Glaciihabitans sp.]|jgi:probable phosphoglycerate mutase|nr:histidine phosphatase family protein [Glaciihabitans sp.]
MPDTVKSDTVRIHFVRHAETLFNVNGQLQGWCDSPLTERGEHQAAALGERLRHTPIAAAFMSDLTRTRTTMAAALAGHPTVQAQPMQELREWHFGSWEGQPNAALWTPVFAELGYTYRPASADWSAMTATGFDAIIDTIHRHDPLKRAETGEQVRTRLATGLAVVLDAAREAASAGTGDVLVVTHGAVIGSMLRHLAPHHRSTAGYPNCGIATVTVTNDVVTVGETDGSCALAGELATSSTRSV